VVLIDEIDVHLHVSWQQRVGFWLKRRFPKVQFIVSSHSPFICQAADAEGLIRLPAPGENRKLEHVSRNLHKRIVRGTADDAALSELFGLESTRSDETEELMAELSRLESRLIRGKISGSERRRYEKLQMELPLNASASVEKALRSLTMSRNVHEET
jgi:predicted ATP-binding protein involved in virulence